MTSRVVVGRFERRLTSSAIRVALVGEATARVLDVVVHTEGCLDDEETSAGGPMGSWIDKGVGSAMARNGLTDPEPVDDGADGANDSFSWKRALKWTALAALGLFLVMQLVPYGWRHSNPPVTADAPWPSAETAKLAREACYDCHSNETKWPIYSYVAPLSWWVRNHVDEGRDALNFSEWTGQGRGARESAETIQEGSMPPSYYTILHPSARLSAAEKQQLINALGSMGQ